MGAILPLHVLIIHQAHVGLIDQSRGLEAVAGALAFHVAACQAVKLVINDGGQPMEGALVSVAPGAEQPAYITRRRLVSLRGPLHALWAELYRRIGSPKIKALCVTFFGRILRLPKVEG